MECPQRDRQKPRRPCPDFQGKIFLELLVVEAGVVKAGLILIGPKDVGVATPPVPLDGELFIQAPWIAGLRAASDCAAAVASKAAPAGIKKQLACRGAGGNAAVWSVIHG